MNRATGGLLRVLETPRLTLVAATTDLIEADLAGREPLARALAAEVPETWPPELFSGTVMRAARAQLADPAGRGWSAWYLLERQAEGAVLVGICHFKGRPDRHGSVEIAYSILEPYRNRGFATEAVTRLASWAFSHQNVVEVTAETLPYRRQSIRILEKIGFAPVGAGSEHGVVRYALRKTSGR